MACCRSPCVATHERFSMAAVSQFVSSRRNASTALVGESVSFAVTLADGEAVALGDAVAGGDL